MRRHCKISGVTIVKCDFGVDTRRAESPDNERCCAEEFRSASFAAVVPTQLKDQGWTSRTLGNRGDSEEPLAPQDLCPLHARGFSKILKTTRADQPAKEKRP